MIHRRLLTLLAASLLAIALSAPSFAAAHPGGEHGGEHGHPEEQQRTEAADWSSYPADIQAIKAQLDKIKSDQKGLSATMRSNSDMIREARKALTDDQKKSLKKSAKKIIQQMKASREDIHALRRQKQEAWDKFHALAASKQWEPAKNELQTILKQKQQIYEKQQGVVKLQSQLLKLITPSHESNMHSVE